MEKVHQSKHKHGKAHGGARVSSEDIDRDKQAISRNYWIVVQRFL
jgi:hypothetical protein